MSLRIIQIIHPGGLSALRPLDIGNQTINSLRDILEDPDVHLFCPVVFEDSKPTACLIAHTYTDSPSARVIAMRGSKKLIASLLTRLFLWSEELGILTLETVVPEGKVNELTSLGFVPGYRVMTMDVTQPYRLVLENNNGQQEKETPGLLADGGDAVGTEGNVSEGSTDLRGEGKVRTGGGIADTRSRDGKSTIGSGLTDPS
jgi:hypothetical protein